MKRIKQTCMANIDYQHLITAIVCYENMPWDRKIILLRLILDSEDC